MEGVRRPKSELIKEYKDHLQTSEMYKDILRESLEEFPEGFKYSWHGDGGYKYKIERCNFGWSMTLQREFSFRSGTSWWSYSIPQGYQHQFIMFIDSEWKLKHSSDDYALSFKLLEEILSFLTED